MDRDDRRILDRFTGRNGECHLISRTVDDQVHHELIFNGTFLMASYNAASSRAMIDAVLEHLPARRNIDLLIGGLGLGITLHGALQHPGLRMVSVVELESRIVAWNHQYLNNGRFLEDPRTEVVVGDFCEYVLGTPRSYHGIVLDIDNGPDWVVRPRNRRAYSLSMLRTLRSRLRSGGALAIWAYASSQSYERALREVFDEVELKTAQDRDPHGKSIESLLYVVRV